jgi:hypothetical protein
MTKTRHNTIVLSIAAAASIATWFLVPARTMRQKPPVESRVFAGHRGWGYDILVNDTVFIHQESVPGLGGNAGFPRREQAVRMSKLIINKMRSGQFPAVTTFELEQIYPANERTDGR